MGFANVAEIADAMVSGRTHFCSIRKVPSQATTALWWADLSMASGNPAPNYYAAAPLTAKTLDDFDGIFHGDDKSPATKHLTALGLMTPTANMVGEYVLCDYLLYYPFIDGDESSPSQSPAASSRTCMATRACTHTSTSPSTPTGWPPNWRRPCCSTLSDEGAHHDDGDPRAVCRPR